MSCAPGIATSMYSSSWRKEYLLKEIASFQPYHSSPKKLYSGNSEALKNIFVIFLASGRGSQKYSCTWATPKSKQNVPKTPQLNTPQTPNFVDISWFDGIQPNALTIAWNCDTSPAKRKEMLYGNIFVGTLLGICFYFCRFL